jgi:hypothetical protein
LPVEVENSTSSDTLKRDCKEPEIKRMVMPKELPMASPKQNKPSEISGFHGGEYEDGCLLGCCALLSGRNLLTFHRCLLPPSSGR